MRTGKTEKQITEIKEQIDNNKTVLIAGLKTPTDYLNRLGEGYVAEESFRSIFGAEKVKTGYIFKKMEKITR